MTRIEEAHELQDEINRIHLKIGRMTTALYPLYRRMQTHHLYAQLDCGTFDEYIDEFCHDSYGHGRTRIYDIIHTGTQLEGSFEQEVIVKMLYENARFLVLAFNDNIPERLRTPELIKAASELPPAQFHRHIEALVPGLHIEKVWAKSFQLSESQHRIGRQAIARIKKETGATSDAQAFETMAQAVVFEGVKETPLDPVLSLVRKVEGIELSRKLAGSPTPTPEQWAEVVTLSGFLMSSLLDTSQQEEIGVPVNQGTR